MSTSNSIKPAQVLQAIHEEQLFVQTLREALASPQSLQKQFLSLAWMKSNVTKRFNALGINCGYLVTALDDLFTEGYNSGDPDYQQICEVVRLHESDYQKQAINTALEVPFSSAAAPATSSFCNSDILVGYNQGFATVNPPPPLPLKTSRPPPALPAESTTANMDISTASVAGNSDTPLAPVASSIAISRFNTALNSSQHRRPRLIAPESVSVIGIPATSRPVPPPKPRKAIVELVAKPTAPQNSEGSQQPPCGKAIRVEEDKEGKKENQLDDPMTGLKNATQKKQGNKEDSEKEGKTAQSDTIRKGNLDSANECTVPSFTNRMESVDSGQREEDERGATQNFEEEPYDDLVNYVGCKPLKKPRKAVPPEAQRSYYPQPCQPCLSSGLPCFIPARSRTSRRVCWHCSDSRVKCPFTVNTFMASGGNDLLTLEEDEEGNNDVVQANARLRDEVVQLTNRASILIDLYKTRTDAIEELVHTYTRREETFLDRLSSTIVNIVHSAVEEAFQPYLVAATTKGHQLYENSSESVLHSQHNMSSPSLALDHATQVQEYASLPSRYLTATPVSRSKTPHLSLSIEDGVVPCIAGGSAVNPNGTDSDLSGAGKAFTHTDEDRNDLSQANTVTTAHQPTYIEPPWSRRSSPVSSLTDISEEEEVASCATPRRSVRNVKKRRLSTDREALPSKRAKSSSSNLLKASNSGKTNKKGR
ncbi:hypothetical protein CVT26_015412 [Gymnopilus dilepis]|uniref:Uncharacterized protein n=1 Tax=Gymnopilus dilepis TaxID=231916 RepID=A0A409YEE8_9AGAR|nr:hypothetical protein CVT26_015412 [Gymnopilus dilepis]